MNNHDPQANPKKLFIGNLPYSLTEQELTDLFSQHGEIVDIKLIVDRMTGRPKGIAFVEYATEEQAQAAIEALHNYEIDGRAIIVNVARPQMPRENRPYGGSGGGGGRRFDNRGGDRGGDRGGYNRGR
jgi:cold-inducible RNA-binding protein